MAKDVQNKKEFDDQMEGEETLLVFRKHPIVMRKGFILSLFALVLGVIPSLIRPEYSYLYGGLAVGALLGLIIFIPSWISWYFSAYIVTDQRLLQIKQKGFWTRSVVDMNLNQIQMVNYEVAGMQETMLGFGTIMMQTFVGDLVVHDVHHPEEIQKKILGILRERGVLASPSPQTIANRNKGEDEEA
ncbi:MAG TPA: PH domain-containing protein [Candidatus Saccharimonadales bacterium]|nr:PH domain-containing protein [Candidatus Saccharimonadales bacterium]